MFAHWTVAIHSNIFKMTSEIALFTWDVINKKGVSRKKSICPFCAAYLDVGVSSLSRSFTFMLPTSLSLLTDKQNPKTI